MADELDFDPQEHDERLNLDEFDVGSTRTTQSTSSRTTRTSPSRSTASSSRMQSPRSSSTTTAASSSPAATLRSSLSSQATAESSIATSTTTAKSTKSCLLRTRTQRQAMRKDGDESSSSTPQRVVHFAQDNNSLPSPSQSSTATRTTASSRGSSLSKRTRDEDRKNQHPEDSSSVSTRGTASSSSSASSRRSKASSSSPARVTRNVLHEDAGNYQMLADEIQYLCSSTHALSKQASLDLALLLSDKRNRSTISTSNLQLLMQILDRLSDLETTAASAILGFVSVDCTPSSCVSTLTARKIRTMILSSPSVMQAILQLVLCSDVAVVVLNHNGNHKHASSPATPTGSVASSSRSASPPQTPDSQGSQGSASSTDPTRIGRLKKRQKRQLFAIPEDDTLSFASHDAAASSSSPLSSSKKKDATSNHATDLDTLMLRLGKVAPLFEEVHSCGNEEMSLCGEIPLVALHRIITGKMDVGDETSILDDGEYDEEHNPILETNKLLAQAEIVPMLSTALTDTAVALMRLLSSRNKNVCKACLAQAHRRTQLLVSVIDGAALLHDENRRQFCEEGFSEEFGGYLLVGLVSLLQKLLDKKKLFDDVWGEISLELMRTLTSLTHENKVAAKELQTTLKNGVMVLQTLAQVFQEAVKGGDACKTKYDAAIFCLNSLANFVESGGAIEHLVDVKVSGEDFVPWLVRWTVQQTDSFRDSIVSSTFGSSPSKHAARRLEKDENERLVSAGNGSVLIACLLIECDEKDVRDRVRQAILADLPGAKTDEKITFLKNALKAFCNFYHFSIGDLSVAVVTPVKKLIEQLGALKADTVE